MCKFRLETASVRKSQSERRRAVSSFHHWTARGHIRSFTLRVSIVDIFNRHIYNASLKSALALPI